MQLSVSVFCTCVFNTEVLTSLNDAFPLSVTQVPGTGAAVLIFGLPTNPVWLYPRPRTETAALLSQLH